MEPGRTAAIGLLLRSQFGNRCPLTRSPQQGDPMSMEHWRKGDAIPVFDGVEDAQDIAAALLLRRVEAMLRNGMPRQAIAHIIEMTGVERREAEAFVEMLKTDLFAKQQTSGS